MGDSQLSFSLSLSLCVRVNKCLRSALAPKPIHPNSLVCRLAFSFPVYKDGYIHSSPEEEACIAVSHLTHSTEPESFAFLPSFFNSSARASCASILLPPFVERRDEQNKEL